ncbi:MAG: DUF721 domain-containing protein [Actinomycetota bacterium]|nr:DUF721 domain-containing protein [Actinomycetota bacterium]MDI6821907.1 DUF721 domain-containing protein [Actinomycetota bacterium]
MFKSIREILNETMDNLKIKKKVEQTLSLTIWSKVVGEEISHNARPYLIKNGILFVSTTSPMWAHELSFIKPELLRALNNYLGKEIVKDIRFQPKGVDEAGGFTDPLRPSDPPLGRGGTPGEIELSESDIKEIEAAVKAVSDEGLREELTKILILDKKFKNEKWQRPAQT